ncbi:MAG: class I SAM-dependent methyltransferase [Deltaproteobacteria bacterium]|nr:class I SAM-dependent methyltransferase [Deltaproteobacteria bacterium]
MDQNLLEIKANLVNGHIDIPIDAKYTSKYSLLIRFLNTNNFRDGKEFANLIVRRNGSSYDLGRCRFISEPNINGYAGRVVCVNDVFDLESLLVNDKIVKLQNACLNLPLLLPLKNKISSKFKKYTSNLTYDLSLYKDFFDNLDAEIAEEPESIKKALQGTIINTVGKQFMEFLDNKLVELEEIVKNLSKEENEDHGFYFRKQLWNTIKSSPFMARTNLKPRGYAGDSEMMSMIYANGYWGKSTFAKLLHKHPLEQPGAQAVRNRRRIIAEKLRDFKQKRCRGNSEKLKILSVACGPACEIQDILLTAADCDRYHFVLLDQDRAALYEAAKLIDNIQKKLDTKLTADFLNESVRTMLAPSDSKKKMGQFDFIYSMGLFDYLLPPVASRVLGRLYEQLKPGGQMVIGNFHVSNPSKYYMEYWLDWVLYYRTEEEFTNLLRKVASNEINVAIDEAGVQMFLHVTKKHAAASSG